MKSFRVLIGAARPLCKEHLKTTKRTNCSLLLKSKFLFSEQKGDSDEKGEKKSGAEKEEFSSSDLQDIEKLRKIVKDKLMVIHQERHKAEKSSKPHRDAILFEEILRNEKEIPLYDCQGRVFRHEFYKNFGLILFGIWFMYHCITSERVKKKYKTPYSICIFLFILMRLKSYRDFQKYFVDFIKYNTADKKFTLATRGFFGRVKTIQLERPGLLFTEDELLNRQSINYINMDTLDCYMIGYEYAWKNKALFTHLISQRIK